MSPRSTRRSAKPAAPPAPSLALRSYLSVLACQSPGSAICRLFAVSAESLNDHLVRLVCFAFLDVYDRYLYRHKCSGLRFGWNDRREYAAMASSKATSAPCAASAITPPGNIRYDPASHWVGYARTVIIRRSDAARTLTRSDDEEIFAPHKVMIQCDPGAGTRSNVMIIRSPVAHCDIAACPRSG